MYILADKKEIVENKIYLGTKTTFDFLDTKNSYSLM